MTTLIFSTVQNESSKVYQLALNVHKNLTKKHINSTIVNLEEYNLPICDGYLCYQDPNVIKFQELVKQASGYIFCSPIYNYDVNAIAKNLIELCYNQMKNKLVGIVVNAGAEKSYMAPLSFINSLMLDFRCLIIPRFVYSTAKDFDKDNQIVNEELLKRIEQLADYYSKLSEFTHD